MTNAPTIASAAPPLEGKRPLVYYGWWIVIGAVVAQFVAMGQNQATNLMLGPMTEELGWTRTQLILPTSIGTLIAGALGFFVGAQVDRRGARPLIIIGTLISSMALILLAYVTELWQFWALRGVLLVTGNVMVGNLVVNATISKWFVDRRGWAIAMAALGVSGWSVLGTQLLRPVVDGYGWRVGWLVLGGATLGLLFVAVFMRRQPEDYGLLPDGHRASDSDTEHGRAAMQRAAADFANSFTRREAVRTPQLWLLILAFGFALTGMTAMFVHLLQFFVDAGFTRTEAAYFYSTQGLFSLLAKFVWGGAMQRVPARYLVALAFTIAGSSTFGLVLAVHDAPWQVVAALAAAWGLGTGGMIPLSEFVWASYFGRRHIGAVRGLGLPFTVMLTSCGPLYASIVFDRTDSYDIAMYTFVAMWLAGAVLILIARQPRHPAADYSVPLAHRLRQPEPPEPPEPPSHTSMAAGGARAPAAPPTEGPTAPMPPVVEPVPAVGSEAVMEPQPAPVATITTSSPPASSDVEPLHAPLAAAPPEPAAEAPPTEEVADVAVLRRRQPRSYMGEMPPPPPSRTAPAVASSARPRGYLGEPSAVVSALGATPRPVTSLPTPTPEEPSDVTWMEAPEEAPRQHLSGASGANGMGTLNGTAFEVAPTTPPAADWRGIPPRHAPPAFTRRVRAVERVPRRDIQRHHPRGRYVSSTTSAAVLAGVATSLVATAALWFITRPDSKHRA
ncbi:MAG: MFS transporter [Dehalococcoidia bacterium]|nr:MFS transporter [Dehalococcoidia bacterium]